MKQLLSILCTIITFSAYSQTVYLADTGFVTDVGAGGAPASCKTNGMIYNGLPMDRSDGIWVADVFTVPTGATWVFDTVIVYGYQYASSTTSPFLNCNLQIYNGAPGLGGSVIWGDTSTNILKSTGFTGIYKVDTFVADSALLSTKRPIMYLKLHLSPAPRLTAGTYWLSWSSEGVFTSTSTVTPYKVLPGRLNPPGETSRIYVSGSWSYATDNGLGIGLNMIIKAKAGLAGIAEQNGNTGNMLCQNVPNPAGNTTTISYNLAEEGYVKLSVYNILGQEVTTLADGTGSMGLYQVTLNTNDLPNGTYYYRLSTATGTESRQMVVMR